MTNTEQVKSNLMTWQKVFLLGTCLSGALSNSHSALSQGLDSPFRGKLASLSQQSPVQTSASGEYFSIQGQKLLDPSGKVFVPRGINMPFAYFYERSLAALPKVKEFGFNSVRVVWCADTYFDGYRCHPNYHKREAWELDQALTRMAELRLVAVFSLQNATGKGVEEWVNGQRVRPLDAMVNYLTRDDIKAVLIKHRKSIIINIANEWLADWTKNRDWVDGYRQAIHNIRAAGLAHVLMIDGRGYGQDASSIEESAAELLSLDPHLLFSVHMYAHYGHDERVQSTIKTMRERQIPFAIGEFGCSHYQDGDGSHAPVACATIIRESASLEHPVGTLAWSYTGNRSQESGLDLVRFNDWQTLTDYGHLVVDGPFGVKATSREACVFNPSTC